MASFACSLLLNILQRVLLKPILIDGWSKQSKYVNDMQLFFKVLPPTSHNATKVDREHDGGR
jgi:hypothetical protein